MRLALDLLESISEQLEEILIGGDDFAGRREFDDGLNQRERVEFTLELCISELCGRDVGRHFDDFQNFALGI